MTRCVCVVGENMFKFKVFRDYPTLLTICRKHVRLKEDPSGHCQCRVRDTDNVCPPSSLLHSIICTCIHAPLRCKTKQAWAALKM